MTTRFQTGTHPLVKSHSETGKKTLYLSRLMTRYIIGMDRAESDKLLNELFDHAERPEFIYAHEWSGRVTCWFGITGVSTMRATIFQPMKCGSCDASRFRNQRSLVYHQGYITTVSFSVAREVFHDSTHPSPVSVPRQPSRQSP